MSGNGQLRSLIERIERTEAEIADLNIDKRDIYAEAKAQGFDVAVMRKIIADRRKDASDRAEFDAVYELYMAELSGASRARAGEA